MLMCSMCPRVQKPRFIIVHHIRTLVSTPIRGLATAAPLSISQHCRHPLPSSSPTTTATSPCHAITLLSPCTTTTLLAMMSMAPMPIPRRQPPFSPCGHAQAPHRAFLSAVAAASHHATHLTTRPMQPHYRSSPYAVTMMPRPVFALGLVTPPLFTIDAMCQHGSSRWTSSASVTSTVGAMPLL